MNEDKANRYHRLRRRGLVASLGVSVALFALLMLTGASRTLRDLVATVSPSGALDAGGVALYALWLGVCHEVLTLWPRVYLGRVERRYHPSALPWRTWLADHLKGTLLVLALGPLGAVALYALIARWPSQWWLAAGGLSAVLVLGAVRSGPAVLPWMAKVAPLTRPELRVRLERLAARAGAAVRVQQYRLGRGATRANAALVGLGRTRRILLSDRLLEDYSDDEIEVVLAHEIAHHVHKDIWKGLIGDVAMLQLGFFAASRALASWGPAFGLQGPADVAGLPLVLLAGGAVTVSVAPVVNLWSRHHERRADRFALELTQNPAAFISAVRRLGSQHLAERPSRLTALLFYSHPPVHERIASANEAVRARRDLLDAAG